MFLKVWIQLNRIPKKISKNELARKSEAINAARRKRLGLDANKE